MASDHIRPSAPKVYIDGLDFTGLLLRVRTAEFPRCTAHGQRVGVDDEGTAYHVDDDHGAWMLKGRGALAIWVNVDGSERDVAVSRCGDGL